MNIFYVYWPNTLTQMTVSPESDIVISENDNPAYGLWTTIRIQICKVYLAYLKVILLI